jgi:hypothetical protein
MMAMMRIKKIYYKIIGVTILLMMGIQFILSNSEPFDRGRSYLPSIPSEDEIFENSIEPIDCIFMKYHSEQENYTCGLDVETGKLLFPEEFVKQISDISFKIRDDLENENEKVASFQISYSDPDKYVPKLPYSLDGLNKFYEENEGQKIIQGGIQNELQNEPENGLQTTPRTDSYFLNFAAYQVELRDRVRCMDNTRALPVTTQWDKNGYFYPTQIAQFALSHFSRFTENVSLKRRVLSANFDLLAITSQHNLPYIINVKDLQSSNDSSENTKSDNYNLQASNLKNFNLTTNSLIINFMVPSNLNQESKKSCHYAPEKPQKSSITLEINSINPAVQIYVTYNVVRCLNLAKFNKCSGRVFRKSRTKLNFNDNADSELDDSLPKNDTEPIVTVEIVIPVYIPAEETMSEFLIHSRNVYADVIKALLHYTENLKDLKIDLFGTHKTPKMNQVKLRFDRLMSVRISDVCAENMFNFELKENSELEFFWNAVDFLKNEYDESGGYPNVVKRKIDGYETLDKGWYGSMVQGHSMSVLARAYFLQKTADSTGDEYFQALLDLMQPFKVDSKDHGVRNFIFGKYVWYEEYPMQPNGQFVLNGFMYSLVGLFDALLACNSESENQQIPIASSCFKLSQELFSSGLDSLFTCLPLFDNGFGSVYDLRHIFSTKHVPPNRARWDYHSVHITLLKFFNHILKKTDDGGQGHRKLLLQDDATLDLYHERFQVIMERWVGYSDGQFSSHN